MSRRTALLIGSLLMVLAAGLLVVFVVRLSRTPEARIQLGDDVFEVGQVRRMARQVRTGGPLLFPDLLRRGRNIYVHHLGPGDRDGWVAFEARAPGAPAHCQLRWQPGPHQFADPCDGRTFPADGTGLVRYRTELRQKEKAGTTLYVDLRSRAG